MSEEPENITYEQFEEYYNANEGLENADIYDKYPQMNKSTLRSWKSRASKKGSNMVGSRDTGLQEGEPPSRYEEQQKHYIQLLMTQTRSKEAEFEGVDTESKILILKNRLKSQGAERGNNTNILPHPAAVGQKTKKHGIDDYIIIDKDKGEIRMEIPMSKLMDPEENKKIRSITWGV